MLQLFKLVTIDCLDNCLFFLQSLLDLKEYVSAAKIQYVSHLETLQNDIHLQKAYINGSLEEISSSNSTHLMSFEHVSCQNLWSFYATLITITYIVSWLLSLLYIFHIFSR